MTNPVMYIFLNKDLHMSVGKASAQAAHAAMVSIIRGSQDSRDVWDVAVHKTIIVLEARDERHMLNIMKYLYDRRIIMYNVIDEGVNEIDPHTYTALASQVMDKDDELTKAAFSSFKLYRDLAEFSVKFER